jgi:hypothetical protein
MNKKALLLSFLIAQVFSVALEVQAGTIDKEKIYWQMAMPEMNLMVLQITMPDGKSCENFLLPGNTFSPFALSCSHINESENLPYKAILQKKGSNEVFKIAARNLQVCKKSVHGMFNRAIIEQPSVIEGCNKKS